MKFPGKQSLALVVVFGGGLAVSLSVDAATLNIVGCDSFSGDISSGTITCVTNSTTPPAPGAPTGCTASASPLSLPAAGGTVTLSGACTGGTVATTIWKRNGVTVSGLDTIPSNSANPNIVSYSYTAAFCTNADGTLCSTVGAGTVNVAAGVASPAPPPSAGSCGSLKVITQFLAEGVRGTSEPLPFDQTRYVTSGFDGLSVAVATIKVPAGVTGQTYVRVNEFSSSATGRRMWLSKTLCDFSATSGPYYGKGSAISLPIWIGPNNPDPSYYASMPTPGETWYVMVKNESIGFFGVTNTCKTGPCEAAIKAGNLQ